MVAVGRLLTSTSDAPLELAVYDRLLRSADVSPSSEIVIAAIDEASLQHLGPWPWARDVHARFIDALHSREARIVAFAAPLDDSQRTSESERIRAALALLESSNLGGSEQASAMRRVLGESGAGRDPDAHLAQSIARHGDVIVPLQVAVGKLSRDAVDIPESLRPTVTPASLRSAAPASIVDRPNSVLLDAVSAVGHTYAARDTDGVVRTDAAAIRIGDSLIPSLATAIAARVASMTPDALALDNGHLVLGRHVHALDGALRTRPHYFADGERAFPQIPYWQIVGGQISTDRLRDKIVIVGFTDPQLAANTNVSTPAATAVPAVTAIASAASSLMTGTTYARPRVAAALEWLAAAAVIAFAAFVLPSAGLAFGAFAAVLLVVALAVSEIGLLSSAHMWVRLALPSVALIAGYVVYALGEIIRRANARGDAGRDSGEQLRNLGQTFQRQGQLDLAFETYQRCPLDRETIDLVYELGLDFERRRQLPKAAAAYAHVAKYDPNYRELNARRARLREEAPRAAAPPARPTSAPPRPPPRAAVEDYEPETPAPTSSRTLGRYEIERELGKGAMGVVYLGRDPKINRIVAIKAIPLAEEFEEEDLAEARARFFREAEMAGRLNHPAIVTVHDCGEDQGLAYIAMEYLRGQHLSHFTDASRLLPPKSVILLVARVAEALHYAHRQNVVHRDIKPANIMFNPDTDELKITDFGIARLTDTSRTKTGIVLGTPSFMSPEQLEGRPLDGRSDQFALGVSLYQLLCGQLPFRAESMPKLMHKIATEPHAPIRLIRPDLPSRIDVLINRTLAKSADDRYVTCGEFAAALRECAASIEAPRTEQKHEWLIP